MVARSVRVTAIGDDGIFYYREWRPDGSIKLEGSFLNEDNFNYRNGTWTFWYKNGVVRRMLIILTILRWDLPQFTTKTVQSKNLKSLDPKPMLNHFI